MIYWGVEANVEACQNYKECTRFENTFIAHFSNWSLLMNSQDVANRFEQSYQKLSDSLDQGLISGETYDHISNVMCDLYPTEAKKVSIANGNMHEDDPIEMASAGLDELFEAATNKSQYTTEFDLVIKLTQNNSYPPNLVQDILKMR